MTTPMREIDSTSLAAAVLAALSEQECSVVRETYAQQLVIGFGKPFLAEWPLRETLRAPWLLYSRYGAWQVTDGADLIITDAQPLDETSLRHARALLLHQRVSAVDVDPLNRTLSLNLENGANVQLGNSEEVLENEAIWAIESPGSLVIEASPRQVTVFKAGHEVAVRSSSELAQLHSLVREVAEMIGLAIFEPPPSWDDPGIDAILTAPNGTVLLVQFKLHAEPQGLGIRAIARRDDTLVTANQIPLGDLTPASMAEQVRQILSAA